MKRLCILLWGFLFFIAVPLFADGIPPQKTRLDNGLTVIVSEMPASPVTAVYAWVKTGAANEGK